ncbi:TolC family protein, partial [bacterium]|nr:TolC family protein [bacterium]
GLMSEQEVMLSAIELNKAKAEVLSTLHRLNTTINELQSLLAIEEEIKISDRGNKKSSHLEIEKAIASQTELSSLIKSVISLALENNPQLQMIQAQVEQQNFNVFIAQNQLLPTLDFTAQYGKNGQGESFDEASDMKGESYQIGLTFSYPFYNRYLTESYYQQRKNLEKIRRRLCDTKTEISNLVTMLIKQLDLLEKRRKNDENQIRIMETFFDYSIKALEKGLITQDKVFLARDDLLKTKTRYRDILIERHKTWANLESLL